LFSQSVISEAVSSQAVFARRARFCRSFVLGCLACCLVAMTACQPSPKKTDKSAASKVRRPTADQLRLRNDVLAAAGLETVWQREVLDGPYRNVYVVEDFVFAVAPKGDKYRLVAHDRKSGENVWTQLLEKDPSQAPAIYHYPDGTNQPSELYVLLGDTVVCMDLRQGGFPLWRRELDFPVSSGICATETHYFVGSFDRRIYGIPKKQSFPDWSYISDGEVKSTGTVEDTNVYFTSTDGNVYRFNEKRGPNGREFFRFATDAQILGSPVSHSRWIYAASTDFKLYALLDIDGDKDWEFQAQAPIRTTPTVASFSTRPRQEILFCISEDDRPRVNRKTLWALNVSSGERLWRFDHVAKIVATGRRSVYVLADRRMNRGKVLLSLDSKTGKENFHLSVEDFDILPAAIGSTPSAKEHAAVIILAHRSGFMQALGEIH
jgi:outer membrane protein assembly factor BamB